MEDIIWTYIIKRLTNTETAASRQLLDDWLSSDERHLQQYHEARMLWELTAMVPPETVETDPGRLNLNLEVTPDLNPVKPVVFWKYGMAATLIGALLFIAFYFFGAGTQNQKEEWVVRKAEAGQVLELRLPDSSRVWLNAETEIRFLKDFTGEKLRLIKLRGEAYFEVKHDSRQPFVVNSGALSTTVYGTSFNVRAYPTESESQVSVNTGKVGVQATGSDTEALMLLPSDQLSYKEGKFTKHKINVADVDSWTMGELIFEQTPMPEVFAMLSRKYKVKIESGNQNYNACKLSARFNKQPLSVVLKTLNISMNISSKQIADTIYLKGGNCM